MRVVESLVCVLFVHVVLFVTFVDDRLFVREALAMLQQFHGSVVAGFNDVLGDEATQQDQSRQSQHGEAFVRADAQ